MPRHERVSLEQIRAKRLAVEAEQAEQAEQAKSSQNETNEANEAVEPQAVVEASTASTGQLSPESLPEPAAASQPSPVAQQSSGETTSTPIAKLPDLDALLNSATPEQLARIKALAKQKGLTTSNEADGVIARDGSMTVQVTITPELTEQLANWKEPTDATLADTARRYIQESLQNYIFGDWTVPESVVAAPAAAPAAAAK